MHSTAIQHIEIRKNRSGHDRAYITGTRVRVRDIYAQSEVLTLRESRSRPGWGIITVRSEGYNQAGLKVISFKRTIMVKQRNALDAHG